MTRYISITLAIPDGVDIQFGNGVHDDELTELLPPPPWLPVEESEPEVRTIAGEDGRLSPGCPVHRLPWRTVPAGISKRTGRPYHSFVTCPEFGCDERPAQTRRTAS